MLYQDTTASKLTANSIVITMKRPVSILIDAHRLEEIIGDYFNTRQKEGARKNTLDSYRWQLAPFLAFWRKHSETHNYHLSPEVIRRAWDWIKADYRTAQGARLELVTAERCIVRLKQVFKWAYFNGCTENINVASWLPKLKKRGGHGYFPTVSELQKMFDAPDDEYRVRDVAIMAFLLSTGSRLMESEQATIDCVEFATPISDLRLGEDHRGSCHLERTKGDCDGDGPGRYVVFDSTAGLLIKAYLRTRKSAASDPLFGLGKSGISQVIRRHAEACCLPELSPHAFRRAFTDHWDDVHGLMGRALLKRQLGHSEKGDVTQQHYISYNPRRIVRDLMQHHVSPLEHIEIDWGSFPVHIAG